VPQEKATGKTHTVATCLDAQTHTKLREYSERTGYSMRAVTRRAILQFLYPKRFSEETTTEQNVGH
jgi:hypothetical protein